MQTLETYLSNIKVECILEVFGLCDDEKIERPTAAEVSNNNGVDWHGGEEFLPWCVHELKEKDTSKYVLISAWFMVNRTYADNDDSLHWY